VRAGALSASDRWPVVVFKPGPHPVETLAARLLPHLGESTDPLTARQSLLEALGKDERGLHTTVQVALASDPDSLRLLLVVDQFEELFTLCRDEQVRADFIANLLYASGIAGGQTVAVVMMRADFFGKCAAYPDLAARLAERDVLVGPMSEEELRRAMEGPAEAVNLHYEKGLVETILDDLGDEPGTLPLLQHTLLELWERRRGGWLTADAYHEIGGVRGALAQRADEVYDGLSEGQQAAARRVLLRLTQPGEGTEDTRRRASLAELLPAEGGGTDVETAVRELADARLLTTGEDEQGAEIVDVAHEALIRGWPRLQGWIDEDRAALRTHRQLTEAALEWEQNGRDASYLYRGARLAEGEEWAESHAGDLNPLEREFLRSSVDAREAESRAARRRIQRVIVGLLAALAIISVLAVVAFQQRNEADAQRLEAERLSYIALSRQLAAQSAHEFSATNYEVALLLAIEAGRVTDTAEAYTALRQTFTHPGRTLVTLSGHTSEVWQATWNSDESHILTASLDRTARVWDAETGAKLLVLSGHTGSVYQAVWNNDGSHILTASGDSTARVWDAQTGAELLVLSGHTGSVYQAVWNNDESRILTASYDRTARVWDAETGAELVTLSGHTNQVNQAVWSSDGSRILTASNDHTARVWDAQTGEELLVLSGHTGIVRQAVWNGDDSRILTASEDWTARVWDAEKGAELVILSGHTSIVGHAVWNSDESRILTASHDDTARVWNAQTGDELVILSGHTWAVRQALWNSDESRILTASSDRTARVWDAQTGAELITLSGHTNRVTQAVWNSDESRILTASDDGTVRLWYARMEDLVEAACLRAPRNMSEEEWRQYMVGQPYRETCPGKPVPSQDD
ncbi:MAG: hypothetical protein JXA14_01200, partial [Anaerolineae bacterium]|nr:hypothetical protein [Anaerolineae bacterium]